MNTPAPSATPEVAGLAALIRDLDPPARLRLAASLLERSRGDLAHAIASPVVAELGATLAMRSLDRRGA